MLTLLHTSTSVQAVVVAAAVSVVPLSAVAVVASLNVVLPVTVLVVTLLLLSHCFSIVHIVRKQLELEIPDRDLESEDDALDPFVEDDFDP